jgi:hypothetical protein
MSVLEEDGKRLKKLFPTEGSETRQQKIFDLMDHLDGLGYQDIQSMSVPEYNDFYNRLREKLRKQKEQMEE